MKQAPHVPEVMTGALAARLAVGRKTLRRAVVAAQAVPSAERDARQAALARACVTPGGQLRWTAVDAEAVLAAHGRTATGDVTEATPTAVTIAPGVTIVRRTSPSTTCPYARYEIACLHEQVTFDHNPTSGHASGGCGRCGTAWRVEGDVVRLGPRPNEGGSSA